MEPFNFKKALAKNRKEYRLLKDEGKYYIYNYITKDGKETKKFSIVFESVRKKDENKKGEKWIVVPLHDNRLLVTKIESLNDREEIWVIDEQGEEKKERKIL